MSDYVETHIEQAARSLRDGNLPSAHIALKRALRRDPQNVDALILSAELLLNTGEPAASEDIANSLFDRNPRAFSARQQKRLGGVCMQNQLFARGVQLFEWVREKGETDAEALYQEGVCLRRLGHLETAAKRLQECVRLRPIATAPYMQLGAVHRSMANTDRAAHYYKKFISLSKREKGTGYWSLADLKSYKFSDDEVNDMHRDLKAYSNDPAQLSSFYFALGAHAESNQDYSEALEYYRKGNEIQGRLKPFSARQFEGIVEGLKSVSSGEAAVPAEDDPVAIFIVGLPRSGTTLVEQILSAHSRVQATDELHFLEKIALRLEMNGGYPKRLVGMTKEERSFLRRQYLNGAAEYLKGESDFFIDKYPGNFLHIGLIRRILPEAIIIDVRRDPRDVAISAFRQLFNVRNEFASSFDGIYEYYKGYLSMMEHWNNAYPEQVRTVQYERLVSSPQSEISALLEFCGLEEEQGCFESHKQKRAVMTPSVSNVKQPIFTTSVGQWRNYEPYAPDEMARLGSLVEAGQSPKT